MTRRNHRRGDSTDVRGAAKRRVRVGPNEIAYLDAGAGPPVLLLHGCPFSAFSWRQVIAQLSPRVRCVAPDLLGLGDTETPAGADWRLPAQTAAVVGLLDELGLERVTVVGHDQGGAIAQLLAAHHPDRVRGLVLANAEAYDNWPSEHELPFVRATQLPVAGRLLVWAWSRRPLFRWALRQGKAVHDPAALTDELIDGYIATNFATAHRRAKTRRFLRFQLDPANQACTGGIAEALRGFTKPTLLIWGDQDVHFGPEWGRRLLADIGGADRLELLHNAGHLVMEEQPEDFAALLADFVDHLPAPGPHDRGR